MEKSGLQEKYEKAGYFLRWTVPIKLKVENLITMRVCHEIEKLKKMKSRLRKREGSILMGKKV